jgi:hypothetical protein
MSKIARLSFHEYASPACQRSKLLPVSGGSDSDERSRAKIAQIGRDIPVCLVQLPIRLRASESGWRVSASAYALLAHRINLQQRSTTVAFGAWRTMTGSALTYEYRMKIAAGV